MPIKTDFKLNNKTKLFEKDTVLSSVFKKMNIHQVN
jgi:hypothetical protein